MDNKIAYCLAIIFGASFAYGMSYLQCLALLVFPIACSQKSRHSTMTVFLFFASAALPIFSVVTTYTGDALLSIPPYLALVLINTAIVTYAVFQKYIPVFISVPAALLILSLPPIGTINPITLLPVAGWLLPGFGLLGIALMLLFVGIACELIRKRLARCVYLVSLLIPLSAANAESNIMSIQVLGEPVTAINVIRPYDAKLNDSMMRVAYRFEELDLVNKVESDVSVLPESIFGVWQESDGEILQAAKNAVYGGARVYLDDTRYLNVVVNGKTGEIVYEQLNAPPLRSNRTAVAVSGRGQVEDTGLSFIICYELTNSLIVYKAYSQREKPVVWLSNLSWSKSDYLLKRMDSLHSAWSRLYSKKKHSAVMSNA